MAFPTTNLFARYEAKSETTYSDNDALLSATDQSANGYNANLTPVGVPTYQTAEVNGHAIYRFSLANQDCLRDEVIGQTGKTAGTVCVVVKHRVGGSVRNWPFGVGNDTVHIFSITESRNGAGSWGCFVRTSAGTVYVDGPTSDDTTQWAVITLVWDGTTVTLYRNGTSIGTPASLAGTIDFNDIFFGPPPGVSPVTDAFDGDIALGGIWDTALDATARADLHTYVQDTYGITVSDYSSGVIVPHIGQSYDKNQLVIRSNEPNRGRPFIIG